MSLILILKSSSTCGVGYDRERSALVSLRLNRFRMDYPELTLIGALSQHLRVFVTRTHESNTLQTCFKI
ncbi:hypothetical protein LEP1GSC008_2278 [Leptospira kirschneri serovar Bulgarica str. Nikolaevo]|uniref:Uncharacterized protein n=2 Tax=Leptospira kirschneri TaxID=29507 RepID=A0A0E2BF14_9LEPT|nr:hypothetical protein LEP1GSC081_3386 [Leptospira kirschneri str. H1]EMK21697.1 hypothetical protein LEP1GSC008_2278 [Leptospira kirschneri serovar Bulgarica str. Nikolaevo]